MTAESLGPMRPTQDVMGLVPVPGRPDDKRHNPSQADARKRRAKAAAAAFETPPDPATEGEPVKPADDDDPHTIDVKL